MLNRLAAGDFDASQFALMRERLNLLGFGSIVYGIYYRSRRVSEINKTVYDVARLLVMPACSTKLSIVSDKTKRTLTSVFRISTKRLFLSRGRTSTILNQTVRTVDRATHNVDVDAFRRFQFCSVSGEKMKLVFL
jgi:hypothetical protein